jgi:hypothetical protein
MAKKTKLIKAQERITEAAKAAAPGVKDVASDALGAAATAAAGVVLQRVSQTLAQGQEKVEKAVPVDDPAGPRERSKRGRKTVKPRSGLRKSATSRKKSHATAPRTAARDRKRAAANKKTLKKVASRKGLSRGSRRNHR